MKFKILITMVLAGITMCYGQNFKKKKSFSFEQEIRDFGDILQLPGYSLVVLKDGKIVHRQMEGYVDLEKKIPVGEDNLFMIASVTKTFTANLMMQYEQEKRANVDDYVLNYRYIDLNNGWPYNIDANTTLRHFMSHTSEDGPGHSFVYNGTRFNYIYGVFEAMGGYKSDVDAFTLELQKKVLGPLGLKHTISGFPLNRADTMFRHIAKPYLYDKINKRFVEDTVSYTRWTKSWPSGSLLSTIPDLIRYARSYDRHELLTEESYRKVTTPTVLNDRSLSPYGIGWFTESFGGKKIHWHYGHANSSAALFVRVPETGYTFIFLSNSNAPSDALRLGSGHIWQSPFAAAFLKHFVFSADPQTQKLLAVETTVGRALFLRYAENLMGSHQGEALQMIDQLWRSKPERFEQYDPGLISLVTDFSLPGHRLIIDQLERAYHVYGHIQPYVINDFARYHLAVKEPAKALEFYKKLADTKGFESWPLVAEACRKTGELLMEEGQLAKGRAYYWKAATDMKLQFFNSKSIQAVVEEMNKKEKN